MKSLQSKIFIFFITLLLVVAAFILLIVSSTTYQHTQDQIAEQLMAGSSVVQNELESRQRYVGSTAKTITKNIDLIEQVASRDSNSIVAALENFQDRAGATFAAVTDVDGKISASTLPDFGLNQHLNFGRFDADQVTRNQSLYAVYKNKAYQVFIWPIYAPEPNQIGCLVMGYLLDDNLTKRLKKLTGMDVSFIADNKIYASSLDDKYREILKRKVIQKTATADWTILQLDSTEYVSYITELDLQDGNKITILLQRSLTDALHDYETLKLKLLVGLFFSLLFAGGGAFYIANTVTQPLRKMSDYIKNFSEGKAQLFSELDQSGEVGILAREFSHMQQEIAEREASILHLAYHDNLTNIANRNEFQRQLDLKVINAKGDSDRFAVLVMDLDNFSEINITLGNFSGDLLLKKTAERLVKLADPSHLIARLGGDEFAILIAEVTSPQDLIHWIGHYRITFNEAFEVDAISLRINATFGIATFPEHAENANSLMQRAEVAMYDAKRKKMPYALYNSTQNHHSILRLALMSELKPAIETNKLVLYYQPKLNFHSNAIDSAECLVRWIHPEHGFISPAEFIPLAEQTGNIRYLTRWVIKTAFAQNKLWRDEHNIFISLSINISAVDLLDPEFLPFIQEQFSTYQIPENTVILEVTESAVMDDPEKAIAILTQLSAMGIQLSIDDFGTGYSSMAQLKRLPVNELKIDKSFVLDLVNNEDDSIIVKSTIELAHNMQLKVVAEGVENLLTLEKLKYFGCDIAQGYYLSKPVAAAQFEKWINESPYNKSIPKNNKGDL